MKRILVLLILPLLVTISIAGCTGDDDDDEGLPDMDFRQAMRDLVISLAAHARQSDPDFIVIPQNGHEILSSDPDEAGPPAMDYINAVDGMGQEDLLYGYDDDDKATGQEDTEYLQSLLDLGEANGLEALVTDYCWDEEKMDDSYARNQAKGYISFAADSRDLDNVPDYPEEPFNKNSDDVADLSDAKNFLYLLDPSAFDTKEDYLQTLRNAEHDVLIIDAYFDEDMLTLSEVETLKIKPQGGTRLVISYMSIGEAEDYRPYWQDDWKTGTPSFIDEENSDWEGNYKVRYWMPSWQNIIFGSEDAYLDQLLEAGFDGTYLDIIEAFEHFE